MGQQHCHCLEQTSDAKPYPTVSLLNRHLHPDGAGGRVGCTALNRSLGPKEKRAEVRPETTVH